MLLLQPNRMAIALPADVEEMSAIANQDQAIAKLSKGDRRLDKKYELKLNNVAEKQFCPPYY